MVLIRFLATCLAVSPLLAQAPAPAARNIRYDLTFNAELAQERLVRVGMTFDVTGTAPVRLSLPAWTPGAYEISNFARHVRAFQAEQDSAALAWDKTDPDTWRVRPARRGTVRVSFDYYADELDNAKAWARDDFLLVNGTTVFLYPEGMGVGFPAPVRVITVPTWRDARSS